MAKFAPSRAETLYAKRVANSVISNSGNLAGRYGSEVIFALAVQIGTRSSVQRALDVSRQTSSGCVSDQIYMAGRLHD